MSCAAPSTSVACSPPSIQTTILPSRASCRAWSSVRPSASARRRLISLSCARLLVVLRRRDDGGVLRAPFGRLADLDDRHAVGLAVHLLEVLDPLRVVDQEVVVADVLAELFFRRRDLRRVPALGVRDRHERRDDAQDSCRADLQARCRLHHRTPHGRDSKPFSMLKTEATERTEKTSLILNSSPF